MLIWQIRNLVSFLILAICLVFGWDSAAGNCKTELRQKLLGMTESAPKLSNGLSPEEILQIPLIATGPKDSRQAWAADFLAKLTRFHSLNLGPKPNSNQNLQDYFEDQIDSMDLLDRFYLYELIASFPFKQNMSHGFNSDYTKALEIFFKQLDLKNSDNFGKRIFRYVSSKNNPTTYECLAFGTLTAAAIYTSANFRDTFVRSFGTIPTYAGIGILIWVPLGTAMVMCSESHLFSFPRKASDPSFTGLYKPFKLKLDSNGVKKFYSTLVEEFVSNLNPHHGIFSLENKAAVEKLKKDWKELLLISDLGPETTTALKLRLADFTFEHLRQKGNPILNNIVSNDLKRLLNSLPQNFDPISTIPNHVFHRMH